MSEALTAKLVVEQLMRAYAAAARAKDIDAFCAIYTENVRIFDAWDVWEYNGLNAWREMVTGWFGSLGDESVEVAFEDVRVFPESGDTFAIASAFVTYSGLSADGDPLRSLQGRMTWGISQAGGGWKIVHEHSSSPAIFETGKVSLKR
ncbi:MAG: DUF4440 domain-containing protein [Cytophagaceae bacterium]|nr:MAG: DUF4440 domain-containing protein [Cytophagaceae bacterium]